MIVKRIVLLTAVLFMTSCGFVPALDKVIPDRRTEYQKSEALPDLEVPPDLTREGLEDPLEIPNEEATTLSEFERQKTQRRLGVPATALAPDRLPDENYVVIQGSKAQIWADLRAFWKQKGYSLEIDDPELGVMETRWQESDSASGLSQTRHRFTVFTEDGDSGSTLLLVSNERQEKIPGEDNADWVSLARNTDQERQVVSEMNLYFYGTETPGRETAVAAAGDTAASAPAAQQARAEVLDLGDEKMYLSLPEEFTRAWSLTESALRNAGLQIENRDRSKGLYYVLYYAEQKEEGFLDKLAFWSDGPEPTPYQISLTGVGDKTELVVLDNEGEWDKSDNASRILSLLQAQYNSGR